MNFEINETYNNIIQEICSLETMNLLEIGHLAEFDALVGETSCQIRAVKIASIYKKSKLFGNVNLEKKDLEFLLLARLLTKSREVVNGAAGQLISHKLNSKILSKHISNRKLRSLATYAQKRLAHLSVEFLQEIASDQDNIEFIKAAAYVLIDDEVHHQRKHCSAYIGMAILLDHIIINEFNILIRIYDADPNSNNSFLDLFYKKKNGSYRYVSNNEIASNEPIIVFEGSSNLRNNQAEDLKNKLIKYNIFDVILAFFAAHDQFIGKHSNHDLPYKDLNLVKLLDQKNKHLDFALSEGCTRDNQDLLFLTHVYATTTQAFFKQRNQISLIKAVSKFKISPNDSVNT